MKDNQLIFNFENPNKVVRLESALLLKVAIDDYTYDPSQFVELQQTACTSLFNLLTQCEECDTKMRVLYIYSLILKRQRGLMSISIAQLGNRRFTFVQNSISRASSS